MKIIITASGDTLKSEVNQSFGRAKKFILYDTEDSSFLVLDNRKNLDSPQGVGIQAGQNVVNTGARAVITGNCGPKAFRVLREAGVKIFTGAKGKVSEAIAAYQEGKLNEATGANVEAHWI
jgi:predicted Fe-Mo cluster-binding NifX family protein